MIFPGFLINYSRRIDISLNIQIYSIFAYIAVVISSVIQIITYKLVSYRLELPQGIFSIPLILILIYVVSVRRG